MMKPRFLPRFRRAWLMRSGAAAACTLCYWLAIAAASAAEPSASTASPGPAADLGAATARSAPVTGVEALVTEALLRNPEIAAARAESEAAQQRIAPSTALDDPMLEAGIVNAPLPFSLRREDMTMKMLGLAQKLPYPGKRALRHEVAAADAASVKHAVDETIGRVQRDVRVAYEELRFALTSQTLASGALGALQQLGSVAEQRYAVGQTTLSDALQAQTQVARLQQELLRLERDQQLRQSELRRLLGRHDDGAAIVTTKAVLPELAATPTELARTAQEHRPQLEALSALVAKSDSEVALARREYYPDFEMRLSYGQRDRTPEGMPRDDMVTMSVAVNLPLWRSTRLGPRVAEAAAMRRQAASLLEAQRLETASALERELATERQQRASAALYHSTIVPQSEAAFESALSAYRTGRVDFATLMEARMRTYEARIGEAESIAEHNKAIAEIDLLTGRGPALAIPGAVQR
jgi:outer membrane protein, heavy metal efflux system